MHALEYALALCSLCGFFGAFGVAHETRLRRHAPLFYLLSAFFLADFYAALRGRFEPILHVLIACASAAALFFYAVGIRVWWRQRSHFDSRDLRL